MLGKFIQINNEKLPVPNPDSYNEGFTPIENVATSEAGTDLVSVVRLDKFHWSGSFNCSSALKAKLVTWCQSPSVSCVIDGVSYNGRLRMADMNLYNNSAYTNGTQGLWIITVNFEEF